MLDFVDEVPRPGQEPEEVLTNLLTSCLAYEGYTRTNGRLRGSELGWCTRLNTFRLHNHDVDGLTGYSTVVAEAGKAVEDLLRINLLKNHTDSLLLYDEWLPKSRRIPLPDYSGKLDFMLDINGEMTVVDIKTTGRINPE